MINRRNTWVSLVGAILVAAATLWLFAWLAEEVLESETVRFDAVVRASVHGLASPALTSLMQAFSGLGSVAALALISLLAIGAFVYVHRPRAAAVLASTMAGAAVLDLVLKQVFHRARPVPFFGTSPPSYSFPSGHALGSLCLYGALAMILSARAPGRWARVTIWIVAGLFAGLVGLSRIYLGVHYPSDVIAGYCTGALWVGAVGVLDKRFGGGRAP